MYIESKLTIYFEEPFWVGVFEHTQKNTFSVCKVTFGAEPKDYEVYEFINRHFYQLRFSSPISSDNIKKKKINPKRMQRQIKKAVEENGIGTKAQRAIKLEQEARKTERKKKTKWKKKEMEKEAYLKKREKKKEKKKGH